MSMPVMKRIGALDIAEAISARIGSFVDQNFFEFLAVEDDRIQLWYLNSGGEGPTYQINLVKERDGWAMDLKELPPGTEQQIEVP